MRNTYSYTLHSFTHIFTNTHTRVVHRTIEHSLPSANEINPLRLINYNVYYVHWPKASNTRSFTYFLDRSSAIHPCAQITRSSETLTQWSKYQKSKYQKPIPLQFSPTDLIFPTRSDYINPAQRRKTMYTIIRSITHLTIYTSMSLNLFPNTNYQHKNLSSFLQLT